MKNKKESTEQAIFNKFKNLYLNKNGKQKPTLERDEAQYKKDFSGEQSPYWNWADKQIGNVEPLRANGDSTADTPYSSSSDDTVNLYEEVMEGINRLSRREKEIVMLLWEGKTQVEVSKMLEITEGALRTYLQRARKKLKKFVSE